jgi:hypothetical protein
MGAILIYCSHITLLKGIFIMLKKVLLGGAIVAATLTATVAQSQGLDLYNLATTGSWPTVETAKYKVDVKGYDMRAYEWRMVSDPDVICVMTFAKAGTGFQCIDTKLRSTTEE